MENRTETKIVTTSLSDKVDKIKPSAEDITEAIARNKSLIFGALIFLLGIISLWIVAKSSCGASFSLKLVPPELQLNSSSCDTQVEQSQKPRVFEGQNMSSNE
jgi:hypothetical protein